MVRNYLEIPAGCTAAQFQSQMAAAETGDSHSKVSDGDFFFSCEKLLDHVSGSVGSKPSPPKYMQKKNTLVIPVLFVVT